LELSVSKKIVDIIFPGSLVAGDAINLNIWHHLNFYDIHFKPNIFSKLW
jgi:hypothetical protein